MNRARRLQASLKTLARTYKDGELDAGLNLAKEIIAEWPENDEAQAIAGAILSDKGRAIEAVAHYREAVRLSPTNYISSMLLFWELWELGEAGQTWAEDEAVAEMGRFIRDVDPEPYKNIVKQIYDQRDVLWPDPTSE